MPFRSIRMQTFCAAGLALTHPAAQSDDAEALARKLSNPVAALISVPFQFNYDGDIGPGRTGDRFTLNIQPVVPITLNADWNIIWFIADFRGRLLGS